MRFKVLFSCLLFLNSTYAFSQDTFSIVALDSTSRQVGSAGASCLDLFMTSFTDPGFLGDILPDSGAINTQSYYIETNQMNARTRMRLGDTPAQIISWLVANDAINNQEFRQYGVVGFSGIQPSSASHTGTSCINYKNHINGSINGFYYAIQGNILKDQSILDSMESGFRNTNGTLACRIMAAMQGANVVGADTRCLSENTSSLFAFLKVAKPTDTYGNPSLNIALKTKSGDDVEPIDSLQILFNDKNGCGPLSNESIVLANQFDVYPNPAFDYLVLECKENLTKGVSFLLQDFLGRRMLFMSVNNARTKIDIKKFPRGIYSFQILSQHKIIQKGKVIIE